MSRFQTAQLPAQEKAIRENEDGDAIFVGMDLKTPIEYLMPGYYRQAINKRVSDGRAATRGGTVKPVFANIITFSSILGSGVYSNPNGIELLLIATPSMIYGISDGSYPISIPIPSTVTLSGGCTFDQNFDKVYLNNTNVTLVWDGVSSSGFVVNTQQTPLDTTLQITPNVPWSQNVASRRTGPLTNSSIFVTPINDYTEYNFNPLNQSPFIGTFRINTSTSDKLVAIQPYGLDNLIVGKRYSIDVIAAFSGTLANASMQTLSSEVGFASRKAVKMVGADVIFPFDTGVYRIQQVIQDRLAASALPVASYVDQYGNVVDPIDPILKQINWSASDQMTACVVAPYYLLAVPLAPSKVNNAILAYNTVKDKWESIDRWQDAKGNDLLEIDDLWASKYQGIVRVYCVDYKAKAVYVLYEGKTDILASGEYPILDSFQSRGYSTASPLNQFKKVDIGISTWNPSITVNQITDQYNDVRPLTLSPVTKDPTKYKIFGKANYNISNINSDFDMVGRQDYSISDGTYFDNNGAGINIDQTQQSVLRFATMARGRWMSYQINNSQGYCAVDGILARSAVSTRQQQSKAA